MATVLQETKEMPQPPAADTSTAPLRSQMKAMESEILNLRADKSLLESDKDELEEALEKIKAGVRNSEDTSQVVKTENQTLKIEMKRHMENKVGMQKEINRLLKESTSLKQQLSQSKATEEQATEALGSYQTQQQRLMAESKANIKGLRDQHALELGKMKRMQEDETQGLLQKQNKQVHEMEGGFRTQKQHLQDTVAELKDTISNQAVRITSYERRIEMLDTENHRLRVSTQLNQRNKLSVTQLNEIEALKKKSQEQGDDIERLQSALSLFHINSHHDFRNLTQ
jgi:chromosome segregation ATPase